MKYVLRLATGALAAGGVLSILAIPAHADWLPTGAPTAAGYPFTMCSDGAGGVYVGWASLGGITSLAVSHITRDGEVAAGWPRDGVFFGSYSHISVSIDNLADDAGGTFVVFDFKNCDYHCGVDPAELRVFRVTAEGQGSPGWPERGVPMGGGYGPIDTGTGDVEQTTAVPDNRRGLIVASGRQVGPYPTRLWNPTELRVQRMDGRGTHLWSDSGLVVRTAMLQFPVHAVTSDGRGGAIVCWLDERAPNLFAQRISPRGEPQWAANGLPLAHKSIALTKNLDLGWLDPYDPPQAITDGSRGAIVAWSGTVARDRGVFAIRVTARGGLPWGEPLRVHPLWGSDGLQLVPAGNGDAILVWRDARVPGAETIHAQRIGRGGKLMWGPSGVSMSAVPGHKNYPALASDGRGGAYIAWADSQPTGEVFATHLDRAGRTVRGWDRNGTPICLPVAAVSEVRVVSDGAGNAIAAWADKRTRLSEWVTINEVQAMRLLPHGPATRLDRPVAGIPKPGAVADVMLGLAAPRFALHGLRPNPGTSAALVSFTLPDAAPATLELYDVAGRRIWSREVGDLGAGEHAVRAGGSAWLPEGVYLARLARGTEVATARMVIIGGR